MCEAMVTMGFQWLLRPLTSLLVASYTAHAP